MAVTGDPASLHPAGAALINTFHGDAAVAYGNVFQASPPYRTYFAIAERLAAADPSNAGWQRDLSVSQERIGDVLRAQGQLAEAVAAFEGAVAGYRKLLARNPDDVQARVFSVVPLWRLGTLKGKDGRAELEAALAILKPLAAVNRLDANRHRWIAQIEAQITKLEN